MIWFNVFCRTLKYQRKWLKNKEKRRVSKIIINPCITYLTRLIPWGNIEKMDNLDLESFLQNVFPSFSENKNISEKK